MICNLYKIIKFIFYCFFSVYNHLNTHLILGGVIPNHIRYLGAGTGAGAGARVVGGEGSTFILLLRGDDDGFLRIITRE